MFSVQNHSVIKVNKCRHVVNFVYFIPAHCLKKISIKQCVIRQTVSGL